MTIFLKTELWPAPLQFFKYCVFVFLCKLSKSLWILPSPILQPVPEGLFKPWKKRWGRLIKLTVSCSHSSSPGSCYQYWYIPRPLGIYFQLQWLAVGHSWITKSLRPWNCCLPLSLNTVVTQKINTIYDIHLRNCVKQKWTECLRHSTTTDVS